MGIILGVAKISNIFGVFEISDFFFFFFFFFLGGGVNGGCWAPATYKEK